MCDRLADRGVPARPEAHARLLERRARSATSRSGCRLANRRRASPAAIVHLVNHGVIKGALFMLARRHRVAAAAARSIADLRGHRPTMPLDRVRPSCVAGLSLIGVPGTAGFISQMVPGRWRRSRTGQCWLVVADRGELADRGRLCLAVRRSRPTSREPRAATHAQARSAAVDAAARSTAVLVAATVCVRHRHRATPSATRGMRPRLLLGGLAMTPRADRRARRRSAAAAPCPPAAAVLIAMAAPLAEPARGGVTLANAVVLLACVRRAAAGRSWPARGPTVRATRSCSRASRSRSRSSRWACCSR